MATGVGADNTSFKLADKLDFSWAGDDNSTPTASSAAYSNYKTGGLYNTSGRSNTGLGIGKIVLYSGLAFFGYWLYKRMKRG